MPLEYSFTGRSMNAPISANFSIAGKNALHFAPRNAQDFAVEEDVFAAGEFGIEARAQFEQRRDAAARDDAAAGGGQDAADDLKQRALAGAIGADDAEDFAALDGESDVAQGPEFGGRMVVDEREQLGDAVHRAAVQTVHLGNVLDVQQQLILAVGGRDTKAVDLF